MSMSFKSIRAEMPLSYKIKGLSVREVFKIQTGKKVVLLSKNLMGKISLTGDLTGSPDGKGKMPEKRVKKNSTKTMSCGMNGGSEGARTLDLLRDRQTL